MSKALNLTYAITNGTLTHIDDVVSGLDCGCICPSCNERLIAKKGKIVKHHFAHHSNTTCEFGYETTLHLLAKEILSEWRLIKIPPVYVIFPGSMKEYVLVSEEKEIFLDRVEVEVRYNSYIPDVVAYSGSRCLFIEIYVTHRVDELKRNRLKKDGISTIEIDLSTLNRNIEKQELAAILTQDSNYKKWLFNSVSEKYLRHFIDFSDKKIVIERGYALHVDWCPIRARVWRGKPYANVLDDCSCCEYCVTIIGNHRWVYCTGSKKISSLNDLRNHLRLLNK